MQLAVLMAVGSTWSRQIVMRLTELGHSVHIIDFRSAQDIFQTEDISMLYDSVSEVHILDSRFQSDFKYVSQASKIRKICRDCESDALLTLYGGGYVLAAWLSRVRPYAIFTVGSDVLLINGIKRWLSRITLNSAGLVFSNGSYLAEMTRKLASDANIIPLLLGVDTKKFSPVKKEENPLRIVCTRRFSPVYNNDYLIHALAGIPTILDNFNVTFTSTGPLLDSARTIAKELLPQTMQNKIEFLGGVNDETLMNNVKRAHIYVSMSRTDGTSTALLEALSCGLFPILSDIPQNREWVDPEANNGILVPLDQPEALADALSSAIKDKAWRERVAEYNRNLVLKRASSHRNIEHLALKLESIIQSYKAKRN